MTDNIVKLLIVIPVSRNRVHYLINEAEQKHSCSYDTLRKMIRNISERYPSKIEYCLSRALPFYIDFENNICKELKYDNTQELQEIKNNHFKFSKNEMKRIFKELKNPNDIKVKTKKLNQKLNQIKKIY